MRWPLRYQILIPFAAVMLVAICAVSVLSAVLATQRAKRQIEEQLQGIAATLVESNFPLTDTVLRQMHGLSEADFVFTDLEGRVLAASRSLELPTGKNPPATDDWQQLHLGPPVSISGEQFFQMVLATDRRGARDPGRLIILYPERFWQEARSEAAVPPLVVGAVALGATAFLAFLIAGRLSRPILELRRQVTRIAQADYAPMPLPHRNDELRDLAGAVNRLAEQLAEMDRVIRRSERLALLGQLAGGLAHHLRNNVTGALMAVQLHARRCDADPESLQVAQRQLALTEENLKQFLAAPQSTPEASAAPRRKECCLADVVQETIELVGPSLLHRRVGLSAVDLRDSADRGSDNHLWADPEQLRHLLVNLVLNAAEAAGPGGWVKIETNYQPPCSPESNNSSDILRVRDNGPGPPAEIVQRLFEPFATSKPEGVGLGLAVARQIAESHGGRIVFERSSGETCFEVHLPKLTPSSPASLPARRDSSLAS